MMSRKSRFGARFLEDLPALDRAIAAELEQSE